MIFLTIINIRESKVLGFIRQAGEKNVKLLSKIRAGMRITCMERHNEHERFFCLLIKHEPQLLRCMLVTVPNRADARDIVQECSVALWRRFDTYDEKQAFRGWALGFVRMREYHPDS